MGLTTLTAAAEGVCDASAASVGALVFLGCWRLRAGLTVTARADGSSGGVTLTGSEVISSGADVSGNATCSNVLASNACSISFASSADRRFLVFRMAMARECRSPSGRLSISRMSCALIAAELVGTEFFLDRP